MELKDFLKLNIGDKVKFGRVEGKVEVIDLEDLWVVVKINSGKQFLKGFNQVEKLK
jgi:hypothetical protein